MRRPQEYRLTRELEAPVLEYLERSQNAATREDIYTIAWCGPPFFGACISWVTACFALSLIRKRAFVMSPVDNWRMVPSTAKSRSWHFYMNSLSPRSSFEATAPSRLTRARHRKLLGGEPHRPAIGVLPFGVTGNVNRFKSRQTYLHFDSKLWHMFGAPNDRRSLWNALPAEADNLLNSAMPGSTAQDRIFCFKSLCLRYRYKPQQWVAERVATDVARLALPDRYMATHVRRGDKVAGRLRESSPISSDRYLRAAATHAERSGDQYLLVVSDSDQVLDEFLAAEKRMKTRLAILWDDTERRFEGYSLRVLDDELDEEAHCLEETFRAFKNTQLLRRSSFLIGTKASWFFRVAQRLRSSTPGPHGAVRELEDDPDMPGHPYYHF
jgi:hypothetical protein